MKKLLTLAMALASLVILGGSGVAPGLQRAARAERTTLGQAAACLTCKRPATPERAIDRCHGNWLAIDNTNRFDYQAAPGPDHFNKTSWPKADRRCEKCPNGGQIRQDYQGLEDWCVTPGQVAATATPSCPSGFTWSCNTCKRPAIPERGVDRCHGNWLAIDNTNRFDYQAAPGPDHFNKTSWPKADRRCEKCPNGGQIRQDYQGLEDWCVIPGQAEATTPGTCPAGFSLEPIAGLAGATPWLNRDRPSGVGDYETTGDHLKIACRFTNGNVITDGSPVGYHCNIKEGGWCKNNDPAGLSCQDMEVMFSWAGGATPWLNRDRPSGVGDYETIKDLLKVSCRFTANGNVITEGAPPGYHCNIPAGGVCKNNDPAGLQCQDMEVMFSW